jgi:serine/threonine protein kinase
MPLAPGHHLGPYEILSKLGAGGIGEVYKARDSKLNREVAIKVLPAALSNDPDYLARFQREAQSLAALHHPNIATIFGLEQNAIVMELIDGQPLQGPLPVETVTQVAKQIAEALEAAHDKGIIHRDLKPANILLTPDSQIKILDFGLAKALEKPTETDRTLTLQSTQAGLILGTAAYMSPEQAAGKPADRRSDIWSFGVVLHELITGQPLFTGETVSHILAEVLKTEIDFTKIPAGPLRQLLKRCLDRNLKTRLQHIGEARIALENPTPQTPNKPPSKWPWLLTAASLALAAFAFLRGTAPPSLPVKLEVAPPEGYQFRASIDGNGSAISPDGKLLALTLVDSNGVSHIHLRSLDSLDARQLPGTDGAARPVWSPDSKSLAFHAQGKLKRVDLNSGGPITLCPVNRPRGVAWREDGLILFGDQNADLQSIPASGGTPARVISLNRAAGEGSIYYPQFLPGGKNFLYLKINVLDREKSGIFAGSVDGNPGTLLLQTEHRALYDPVSGRLLYIQGQGTLMARRMELDPPRLSGDPIVVAERVLLRSQNGFGAFSVSSAGALFFARELADNGRLLAWRDRAGKLLNVVTPPLDATERLALSPDSSQVAYATKSGSTSAWLFDLTRGAGTRLSPFEATSIIWSSDGKYLYYGTRRGTARKAADGSGQEEIIYRGRGSSWPQSLSPDGKTLLFGQGQVLALPLIGQAKPEPYLDASDGRFGDASFSPDGHWVAYGAEESGRRQVFIQGFPERRAKILVSPDGGLEPHWRADGKELFWRTPDNSLMAASIDVQGDTVRVGRAEKLFDLLSPGYQPSRDGRRFLVRHGAPSTQPDPPMVLIQNWAAGLPK